MQIKYYIIDPEYAKKLELEKAYKDTRVEQLPNVPQPKTVLSGVTEHISLDGLSLVSNEPIAEGTYVVADITIPKVDKPLRTLAQVISSDSRQGKVVDRTVSMYNSNLKIIAINRDDMKRIENYMVEQNLKEKASS